MRTYAVMNGNELAIDQGIVNGWHVSFNPDDGRWYVAITDNGLASATFATRSNAMYYAKTH